jgi:hypothetical protein
MNRKKPPAGGLPHKKPPAPSIPKPTEKLDPAAWRAAAKRHLAGTPTTMRERRWTQLYILGATPEQAADEARTHHANSRASWERRGKR